MSLPAGRNTPGHTAVVRPRDPLILTLVMFLYVLPLGAAVVLLALAGLPQLALALLAVEAVVSAAVIVAKRPARTDGPVRLARLRPTRLRPTWTVPLAFAGVLVLVLAVTLIAARAG